MKYQNQLMNEIQRLQQSMGPIIQELYQGLGLMNQMGMGGMGQQQMPTMEQLQALQAQDPEAFEQYMAYMQMQMQGGRWNIHKQKSNKLMFINFKSVFLISTNVFVIIPTIDALFNFQNNIKINNKIPLQIY